MLARQQSTKNLSLIAGGSLVGVADQWKDIGREKVPGKGKQSKMEKRL